jgi:hypothetical protein
VALVLKAPIERDGIPSLEAVKELRERLSAGLNHSVEVIRHDRPRQTRRIGIDDASRQPIAKVAVSDVGQEDVAPFDGARPDVVDDSRSVEARRPRHGVVRGTAGVT